MKKEEVLKKLCFEGSDVNKHPESISGSCASQAVDDSVECESVGSKPDSDVMGDSAVATDTKLRAPSEKSSEDEYEGDSEVTVDFLTSINLILII